MQYVISTPHIRFFYEGEVRDRLSASHFLRLYNQRKRIQTAQSAYFPLLPLTFMDTLFFRSGKKTDEEDGQVLNTFETNLFNQIINAMMPVTAVPGSFSNW